MPEVEGHAKSESVGDQSVNVGGTQRRLGGGHGQETARKPLVHRNVKYAHIGESSVVSLYFHPFASYCALVLSSYPHISFVAYRLYQFVRSASTPLRGLPCLDLGH